MSFGEGYRSVVVRVDQLLSRPALVKPFEEVFDESMADPTQA